MNRAVVGAFAVLGVVAVAVAIWTRGEEVSPTPLPTTAPAFTEFVFTAGTVAGFVVDEELRGSPNVVVGISEAVSGRFTVDLSDPSSVRLGEIRVDARAFDTGSALRDMALRRLILDTETYPYISFVPIDVGEVRVSGSGDTVEAVVIGTLTVRDVTRPVSVTVSATVEGDRLVGEAVGVVSRSEFGLRIPSVRGVANVSDVVEVYVEFVAEPP